MSTPLAFKISWIICGESWSEISGNGSEIGSNSMWILLTGREVGLVYYVHNSFHFENICSTNQLTVILSERFE